MGVSEGGMEEGGMEGLIGVGWMEGLRVGWSSWVIDGEVDGWAEGLMMDGEVEG